MSDHIDIEDLLIEAVKDIIAAGPADDPAEPGYALTFTPSVVELPEMNIRKLTEMTVELVIFDTEESSGSRSSTTIDLVIMIACRKRLDRDDLAGGRAVRRTVNQIRRLLRRRTVDYPASGGNGEGNGGGNGGGNGAGIPAGRASWIRTNIDPMSDPIARREDGVHHTNLFITYRITERDA